MSQKTVICRQKEINDSKADNSPIICKVCGKEFIPKKQTGRNPVICSKKCKYIWRNTLSEKRSKITAICAYCGKEFKVTRKHSIYCSMDCYRKTQAKVKGTQKECPACGKMFEPHNKKQKYCSKECFLLANKLKSLVCICKKCGKEFIPKRNRNASFCSNKCISQYYAKIRKKQIQPIKKCAYCGKEYQGKGKYCSEECKEKQHIKNKTKTITCKHCGKQFITTKNVSYCSEECRTAALKNQQREYRKRRYIPRKVICKECGKEFLTEYGNMKRVFCSDECFKKYGHRVAKATRRAKVRCNGYEFFDPHEVLRRDNYTCQICGVKTPIELRGTLDDCAPELDHIIPLALGGEHSKNNTQCLCRKCNHTKGATLTEDYLRAM